MRSGLKKRMSNIRTKYETKYLNNKYYKNYLKTKAVSDQITAGVGLAKEKDKTVILTRRNGKIINKKILNCKL